MRKRRQQITEVMNEELEILETDEMAVEKEKEAELDLDLNLYLSDEDIDFEPTEEEVGGDFNVEQNMVGDLILVESDELKHDSTEYDDVNQTLNQQEQQDEIELGLSDLKPSVSSAVKRTAPAGVLSIVNSNHGKRFLISSGIVMNLQLFETAQIGYAPNYIVIAEHLGEDFTTYGLKTEGKKMVIYSTELVYEATNFHQLDFSDRTSITFSKVTYETINGKLVAVIHIR
ncbi:RPC7 family DNA-directed RNA polymerase III subunit [Cytobacillus firmus]|uniref:hypothetical protein n=1 Tax=Cytobacillus firmus TaxID=1399 RepID=UPI002187FEBF|nr:hypothetical protein [Cytobacillus firmus]URM33405.1 RPC7 family DNA-directed RNA polymerase III subunit [Cytobacillus firmus]